MTDKTNEMNKSMKILCKAVCAAAFLTLPIRQADARETIAADTVSMGELVGKKPTQLPLKQCHVTDISEDGRYAVVSNSGKRGIYDLIKGENVTEINMDEMGYSRHVVEEDSIHIYYFWAERGLQSGIIGVIGSNNHTMAIWVDNPDLIATLSECTTIDEKISRKCRKILKEVMELLTGSYGQVAVLDAQTGHLKAWVALKKDTTGIADAKLLKKSCSAHLFAPVVAAARLAKAGIGLEDSVDISGEVCADGDTFVIRNSNPHEYASGITNYRSALAGKSTVAMFKAITSRNRTQGEEIWGEIISGKKEANAMELAAVMNCIYHQEELRLPTLKGDSIETVDMSDITPLMKEYMRAVLSGTNSGDGSQAGIAPKCINIAGLYGRSSHADGKDGNTELSYAGCFPAENSRYAIGVFMDIPTEEGVLEANLAEQVNKLIEWLNQRSQ